MKFGKHVQKRQLELPEYAANFVNYKALKKLIKQLALTPPILPQNASEPSIEPAEAQGTLQAKKAAFFFRLERELEKVNAFYVQKEAELKLRLKTLLDRKGVLQTRTTHASKISAAFVTVEEGFQQFCTDLNKLQQFVEINNIAFSKILKKWDKTSKSRTKELYLSRAVEVQPCFNRDVISELSDQATTSLQELGAWAEGENIRLDSSKSAEHTVTGQPVGTAGDDTDSQVLLSANTGNTVALQDWITRLQSSADAQERFTRIFLAGIADAPEAALNILVLSELVNIQAEDDINERNCLHEAAISGRDSVLQLGIEHKVDVSRVDVYGRIPLHYACISGYVHMVRQLLSIDPTTAEFLDHDNYTPLVHAIAHHRLGCVQELIRHGVELNDSDNSVHVPLNLACHYGSYDIVKLLLRNNAHLRSDAEGLYPQHLVARAGVKPEMLLLLEQYGADLDQRDNLYQWTPLFHAASEGRVDCIKMLLQKGADKSIQDEKGHSALYYATWEGHLSCMRLLGFGTKETLVHVQSPEHASARSPLPSGMAENLPVAAHSDGIPDLSLPPPIIPLRRYGHNFLDQKTLIQMSFPSAPSDAIIFYHDSKYPAARLTISSKTTDIIPRNLMLPMQEDTRIITFQIDSLENFTVDFDLFPSFGSKMIARSVALPSVFSTVTQSSGSCCLPLFDPRLRAIGQITFEYQVIKPFHSIPLDIANFATYWRATSQVDTRPNGLITGSSLKGNYVQLRVQLTKDRIPVLYSSSFIDYQGIELPTSYLTHEQGSAFLGVESPLRRSLARMDVDRQEELYHLLTSSFLPLRDALELLPTTIHVNVVIVYPTTSQEHALGAGLNLNINEFVDAILADVFNHARMSQESSPDVVRSIVFSSYNTDICIALNWKQPNYPVLFCNDLGADYTAISTPITPKTDKERNPMSVKEALRIAQSNNFMGLMCTSQLLRSVPQLIKSIKEAGILLVMEASADADYNEPIDRQYRMPEGVDGILKSNRILRFNESVDM